MRIYIYKIIILVISLFFLYQFTIGYTIYKVEKKIMNLDKATIEKIKEKARDEIKSGLSKDNILNKDDALLIKQFIDKISSEIQRIQ